MWRMSRLNTFLSGIRVIDLSRHLPGPLATLLMADMGADVIKIEPPAGDEMRSLGPQGDAGTSMYFQAVNAGKTTRRSPTVPARSSPSLQFWARCTPARGTGAAARSILRWPMR